MPQNPLYERELAVERIKAARAAIDADNSGVLLTGRCEGFLVGQRRSRHGDRPAQGLCGSRRRLPLRAGHQDQGADRGGREGRASKAGQSADRCVRAVAEGGRRDLGVRRISVGGSLARTAWAGFMRAAREMAEKGTFAELANGYSGGELNKMFS